MCREVISEKSRSRLNEVSRLKLKRRQEDKTSAELNPVYGIYQLEEGSYERQYSTHEIVDDNHYYAQ